MTKVLPSDEKEGRSVAVRPRTKKARKSLVLDSLDKAQVAALDTKQLESIKSVDKMLTAPEILARAPR